MLGKKTATAKVDEGAPLLTSLAAEYSFENHGLYFTILKNTIEQQPRVRNIALAGTYGTGKSSILRKVADEFRGRVVEVSLLTLGAEPATVAPSIETNPAATSTTNRIQKEIVKQLLYQQKPNESPESRFRRIVRFRWLPELAIAAGVGAVAVVLALIAGLDIVVTPFIGLTISDRPQAFAVVAMFVAFGLLAGALTLLVRSFARGRMGIEKVTAGPATITLPPRSASYFDEYLDEIIYFFETNAKLDIVIIEDLDRFNDPNIFEALRSLNGILNSAKQLGGRDIRFIYAVRDSVFEKLGRDDAAAMTDEARAELTRANRTKFFELVVPVVPFITHKNARDLMSDQLKERGHQISKDLVDLAARHVADMRLIHNILNEYEVFKRQLIDVPVPVPELDPNRLFAMILFKNAHMAEFEKIRHGDSALDDLWEIARALVRANIDELRHKNRELRERIESEAAVADHAESLSDLLITRLEALANASGTGIPSPTVYLDGAEVARTTLRTPDFWRELVAKKASLTVNANAPAYSYGPQTMELTVPTLEALLGRSIDVRKFDHEHKNDAEDEVRRNEDAITALPRMTWEELAASPRYVYTAPGEIASRSFRGWAEHLLPSKLAADLATHGFITSYFPLHVSSFYGTLVRPNAMTYVMRFVDHGGADPDFVLDADDVEALLWSEGKSVLSERSMFNIGIVDHLLRSRPDDAATVIANVAGAGSVGEEFSNRYLESGNLKAEFVALLAPMMPKIYTYLASTDALADSERPALMDEAIAHRDRDQRFVVSEELRAFLTAHSGDLPSLAPGADPSKAEATVRFLWVAEVYVPSVRGLSAAALRAFKSDRAYALTRENLELITGSADISLDALAAFESDMFAYAAEAPAAYVSAYAESEAPGPTTASSTRLLQYLELAVDVDRNAAVYVATHAAPDCMIPNLKALTPQIWPALVKNERVEMTFNNLISYLSEHQSVDENLARSLAGVNEIATAGKAEPTQRQEAALAILNSPATDLTAEHRVRLATSLSPGELPTSELEPRPGKLVGELIRARLIADDEEAFAPRLMVDWPTQAHAIAASTNFKEFVSPASLSPAYVAPLLSDTSLAGVHYPVVQTMSAYNNLPLAAYEAYAARALMGAGYSPLAGGIKNARAAGVSVDVTLELAAKFKANLSHDELRDILRELGTPWSKIADPGYGPPIKVDDSPSARTLVSELQQAGVVSKWIPQDGRLMVSRRQK